MSCGLPAPILGMGFHLKTSQPCATAETYMTEEDMHMADPTASDDTGVRPGRAYPGTPRWVKVFGISAFILVLLVVVVLVVGTALGLHTPSIGPGGHGPGRHIPSGGAGGHPPLASVTADGVRQS